MDMIKIGKYIQSQRKAMSLTQKQLAQRLNVSFQAVSKWENGDALPDAGLLLDLADALNTSTDKLLTGGTLVIRERRRMRVADVIEGFQHIEAVGRCFGEDSLFYTGMVEGINNKMNIDIISYLSDPQTRDIMIAEVLIQGILNGYTLDMDEVRANVSNPQMIRVIEGYLAKTDEPVPSDPLIRAADGYRNARRLTEGLVLVIRLPNGKLAVYDDDQSAASEKEILADQKGPVTGLVCCRFDGELVPPSAAIRDGLIKAFPENADAVVYLRGQNGVTEQPLSELK